MSYASHNVIALIPARGGSKGVVRKNLRNVGGKPLLSFTIEAAKGSVVIDEVLVSSDDQDILATARQMGIGVIERSLSAASDDATAADVVTDFLERYGSDKQPEDAYIVYLQPTSPLRTAAHIDAAFEEMACKQGQSVISVIELTKPPHKSLTLDKDGLLRAMFSETVTNANRQDLPPAYYPNGAIYIFRARDFIERGAFPCDGSVPFVMSDRHSLDIDTEEDLQQLERTIGAAHD